MKSIKYIFFAAFVFLASLRALSCSCIGPDKFMNSIGELVVRAEVIGIKALDTSRYAYTVTLFRVSTVLKGEFNEDTLYLLNDKGFECFKSVPYRDEGREYILTGSLLNEWNAFEYRVDSSYFNRLLVMGLCSESFLFIDGDKVRGNITKNRGNKVKLRHKIYARILSEDAYSNWLAKRTSPPKSEKLMQSRNLYRFEKKLQRRFNQG